jgi:hypothetical protein
MMVDMSVTISFKQKTGLQHNTIRKMLKSNPKNYEEKVKRSSLFSFVSYLLILIIEIKL